MVIYPFGDTDMHMNGANIHTGRQRAVPWRRRCAPKRCRRAAAAGCVPARTQRAAPAQPLPLLALAPTLALVVGPFAPMLPAYSTITNYSFDPFNAADVYIRQIL
jgi:hypothetical protein